MVTYPSAAAAASALSPAAAILPRLTRKRKCAATWPLPPLSAGRRPLLSSADAAGS